MQINIPSVQAEVQALFDQYEDALIHNKIDILDNSFGITL